MSQLAELHVLKQRIAELESTVEQIDRGQLRQEEKLRDRLACAFAAGGRPAHDVYFQADEALKHREAAC